MTSLDEYNDMVNTPDDWVVKATAQFKITNPVWAKNHKNAICIGDYIISFSRSSHGVYYAHILYMPSLLSLEHLNRAFSTPTDLLNALKEISNYRAAMMEKR